MKEKKQIEEKWAEYAFQLKRTNCKNIVDHDISWCGDCYACSNCGKIFIWSGIANQALTTAEQRGAEKERERINKQSAKAMKFLNNYQN